MIVVALLAVHCHALLSYEASPSRDAHAERQDIRSDARTADRSLSEATSLVETGALDAPDADLAQDAIADQARDVSADQARDVSADQAEDSVAADGHADTSPDIGVVDAPIPDLAEDAEPDLLGDLSADQGAEASTSDAGCGALVISEMMIDPQGKDPEGEWFELYNGTAASIDLHGWVLKDKDASHTISSTLLIAPGEYLVLKAEQADLPISAYVYSTGAYCPAEICFLNEDPGDRLEIWDKNNVLVDEVVYTAAWPYAQAASMSLRDPCLDNAVAASWCQETQTYDTPTKNAGTPGQSAGCQ